MTSMCLLLATIGRVSSTFSGRIVKWCTCRGRAAFRQPTSSTSFPSNDEGSRCSKDLRQVDRLEYLSNLRPSRAEGQSHSACADSRRRRSGGGAGARGGGG